MTTRDRIVEFLEANPSKAFTTPQLAQGVGAAGRTVRREATALADELRIVCSEVDGNTRLWSASDAKKASSPPVRIVKKGARHKSTSARGGCVPPLPRDCGDPGTPHDDLPADVAPAPSKPVGTGCKGIEIEPGVFSGCRFGDGTATESTPRDCPACCTLPEMLAAAPPAPLTLTPSPPEPAPQPPAQPERKSEPGEPLLDHAARITERERERLAFFRTRPACFCGNEAAVLQAVRRFDKHGLKTSALVGYCYGHAPVALGKLGEAFTVAQLGDSGALVQSRSRGLFVALREVARLRAGRVDAIAFAPVSESFDESLPPDPTLSELSDRIRTGEG